MNAVDQNNNTALVLAACNEFNMGGSRTKACGANKYTI